MKACVSDKHIKQKSRDLSAYHQHVLSSILPDVERELTLVKSKNKNLEREKKALQKRVEHLMTEGALLKVDHQRAHKAIQSRDLLRSQLVQSKNQLVVLGKKINLQESDLRRERRKNEVLKQELESVKKELQLVKKQAANQRAEHQKLKEQLEQVVKDKDGLNAKWVGCQNECSKLREKIGAQQSSLNKKESQCMEEMKQVHLLKLENEKLEREKNFLENLVAETKLEARKFEEELISEREKLIKSTACRSLENLIGGRVIVLQQNPQAKPKAEVSPPKNQPLQKELLSQAEELRRTQKLGEGLKQSLTQLCVQHQQSQAALRRQKEKLKAVTAQRNVYQTAMQNMQREVMAMRKERLGEKLKNWTMQKNKKIKVSSATKCSQSLVCSIKSDRQAASSKLDTRLMITGKKLQQ